tara:strand:+ start:38 stop:241 length:204 start_codon:yes stop_codon:yes gene_type:complete
MKNQKDAGAYVFSRIVDSLWIAKMTLKSFLKVTNGGRIDETAKKGRKKGMVWYYYYGNSKKKRSMKK